MRAGMHRINWLAILLLGSCRISGYEARYTVPDERIDALIQGAPDADQLRRREPTEQIEKPSLMRLDALGCVRAALTNNRRLLETLERQFLARIDADLAAHNYWPLLKPLTVTSSYIDVDDARPTRTDTYSAGLTQRLLFGGSADLTLAEKRNPSVDSERYSLTPTVSVSVPLWRGSGAIVANSDLVTALRVTRYTTRELEHFRQVLAIDIVRQYYTILQQRRSVLNFEQSLENAKKLRDQSDAMYRFGRVTKTDLFRADLQVTQAENDLLNAREGLKLAEDLFKLELALPPETPLELADEEIAHRPLVVDEQTYPELVLRDNLLWQNTKDQFEDEKRLLVVAKDQTSPKLDLSGSYSFRETSPEPFDEYEKNPEAWSAMLSLELPLDRAPLRRDYQVAVIKFIQAERNFVRSRDELSRQVRQKLIAARQADFNVRLQTRAVDEAEKAVKLLTFEYRQGKVANRDVIEAQNKLIAAQNALLRSLVDSKIAQLDLKQFSGSLTIDTEGRWLKE